MRKLLAHFFAMQDMASTYVEPGNYADRDGNVANFGTTRNGLFANDMVYMLDGPEERAALTEAQFDYVAEATLTLSNQYHGELVIYGVLRGTIHDCIASLNRLDNIKKALFYGREGLATPPSSADKDCNPLPNFIASKSGMSKANAENLIHGIIGLATEAGELLELLNKAMNGERVDLTNLEEEVGDGKWYMAILAKVGGFLWGNDERRNIAKLRSRFPNAFTEYDANNRDLVKERQILEADANQFALPINGGPVD